MAYSDTCSSFRDNWSWGDRVIDTASANAAACGANGISATMQKGALVIAKYTNFLVDPAQHAYFQFWV